MFGYISVNMSLLFKSPVQHTVSLPIITASCDWPMILFILSESKVISSLV